MFRTRVFFLVAIALAPSAAWPQGNPVGPEFRVNTYTTNTQRNPSVAADASGSFVVVWGSYQDGSLYGIFGQRFAASGIPLGPEFRVNTYTTGAQANPAVATAASGSFVVVWESNGQDGSNYGVFGQRYDSAGAPLGPEFRVNTFVTGQQYHPSLAADSLGNFVVVWQQDGGGGVFGQRYASSGAPLGPEFRVNTSTFNPHLRPSVASDPSGNFMVVWARLYDILGQRYSNSGAPVGSELTVATPHHLEWVNTSPSVAADSSGNLVVVWTGGDTNFPPPWNVYGRRFFSAGASGEFRVNTYATNNQDDPAVAADASGNFVVVWRSAGQDGYGYGIFGQRYLGSGAPLGPEFRVNTYTTFSQTAPTVAVDPAGNFVVAWSDYWQDGSSWGTFGQRYSMIVPVELMHFRVE